MCFTTFFLNAASSPQVTENQQGTCRAILLGRHKDLVESVSNRAYMSWLVIEGQ